MTFIAKDSGGGDFRRVPPGVYVGRCYALIDIGTQEVDFQGEKKLQRKLLLRWELFGEDDAGVPLTVEVDGKDMPMTVAKRYTLSLSNKARLRGDLAAWRGRDFTDEELKSFDVSKLVGAYAMVNITENETNGKTYSNVASLTPLPKALNASKPAGVHAPLLFDVDKPDMAIYESFHDKLRATIESSLEWQSRGKKAAAPLPKEPALADMEDDVPFIFNTLECEPAPGKARRLARADF